MALNKEVFKTRALTAVIFAAVMLVGLLWNMWSFLILMSVIHFGCWVEYFKLIENIYKQKFLPIYKASLTAGAFAICLSIYFFRHTYYGFEIWNYFIVSFGIISFILLIGVFIKIKKEIFSKASFSALLGVVYISISIGMLIWLYEDICFDRPDTCALCVGNIVVISIIFSIWINDTMAYIVGSFIGKTPFSKISPKKTWEGTIGGAVLCVVVMGLLGYFLPVAQSLAVKHWAAIAAICAVFGTLGDLLESKIKRLAGVKDSGSFMPGHGGFLDRFDSLLIAAPFVWLYVQVFVV